MTIFMIHSMWGTAAVWNNYAAFFKSEGYVPKAITLLYHGDISPDKLKHVGMSDYIAQAKAVIEKLGNKPIIIGHSMGGLIAQKLAEMGLAEKLVLLAPAAPQGIPMVRIMPAFFGFSPIIAFSANIYDILLKDPFLVPFWNAAYGLMNTMSKEERVKAYREDFVYESGLATYEVIRGKVDVDENKVTCPVLVIAAGQDKVILPKVARKVADKYNANYIEYPEHCHYSLIAGSGWQDVAKHISKGIKK